MHHLSNILDKYQDAPFEWGKTDCCMMTSDIILELTGVDPADKFRGEYTTETGAKRALVKYGSIEDTLDQHFKRISINFANRGDPVMFTSELGVTMGVKWLGGLLVMTHDGLRILSEGQFEPEIVWGLGL